MSTENTYSFLVKNTSEENKEVSLLDNQDKEIIILPIDARYSLDEVKEQMKDLKGNITIRIVDSNNTFNVKNCLPTNSPVYHIRKEGDTDIFQYLYFEINPYQFQNGIVDILAKTWGETSNVRFSLKPWTRMTIHILQTPEDVIDDKPLMEVKQENAATAPIEETETQETTSDNVVGASADEEGSNNTQSTPKPSEAEALPTPPEEKPVIDINTPLTQDETITDSPTNIA